MKTLITISLLPLLLCSSIIIRKYFCFVLFILINYIYFLIDNAQSVSLHDKKSSNQVVMSPYLNDDISSSVDEYGPLEDSYPVKIPSFLNKRRTDSAEKYFDWASKTNRKFINKKNNQT